MSTSDISPPRQKGDISKGEMENQAGGQPTAVPDPSHTELTKDEFVTKTSRNQPTEAESLCDAQRSKEEATIPEFTACEEKRLPSREVEGPSKDEDGTKRRGDRVTNAGVLIAECEDDLDYDELMESEAYDRSTQHQAREFVDEEDEVKVHVTEDIEEGEISSDEEGEIKDDDAEEKQGEKEEEEEDGEGEESRPPVSQAPKLSVEAEPTKLESSDASPRPLATENTRGGKEEKEEEEEGGDDEREGRGRKESSDEKSEASSDMEESEMHKEAQELKEDKSQLCRHFLHGKCSWGNQCRFLHANPAAIQGEEVGPWMEKLPPHDRMGMHPRFFGPPLDASRGPPLPPHMREGGPRGFPGPQGPLPGPPLPGFVRGPPPDPGRGMPPHMGPPHPEMDMVPPGFPPYHRHHHPHHPHMPPYRGRGPPNMPYPPYGHLPGPRKDMKTAEVAEESEGWFRLRTIPVTWSSDEEEGGRRGVPEDLRHKLKRKKAEKEGSNLDSEEDDQHSKKKKRKRQSKQGGGEEWTDPWARHGGKTEKVKTKKKKKKREPSTEPSENESSSAEETRTKPKKKEKQKSSKKLSESPKTEKKNRKKSDRTPSAGENSGSESEGEDKEKRSKKKGRKKSEKKLSSKLKKSRHDERSSNSSREEEEEEEETLGKKRKRKVGKKERKADSDSEEEKRSRRRRKHHHTSLSPSPERYRESFYPPHPFPFPPSDGPGRSRWPPHPGRPFDPHYPPPPRGYGGPEHERYSGPRKMDFEDWKRYRRDPPPPPVSQMGYRRGPPSPPYPPYEGGGHRRHLPSHPQGQHHRDRGSSEDRSHSVTPAPNHSPSSGMDSSPERNSSQKGERKDFPEPHKGRGREEKRKGEGSTQRSSRTGGESGGKEKSKTLSRREKLLQELQAIDEVIERKKSKKRHGHS